VGQARGDHINIPRQEVLAGIAAYPEEDQADLLWLHGYCLEALHGSRSALVEMLGVDWTTITRVWRGAYGADIGKFLSRVRHHRHKAEVAADTGFVETVVTRKIWQTLDMAAARNCIARISGDSGRSKTHAVREWVRRNNHGRATYIDCPVTGGLRALLEEVSRRACIGLDKTNANLVDIISRAFDYRHVLVFDEVQRLLPAKSNSITPIEWIRRLHDTTQVGVVLISTYVFPREMVGGRLSLWFEQLLGRIETPLDIPARVSRQECAEICAAFCHGDPPPELVSAARPIANGPGKIRVLFTTLRHAAMLAAAKKESLGAAHLAAALEFRDNINRWPSD
jgi:DNA transposition AAA+ family ATPase